jgi:subtilisin family serine protease
MATEARDQVDYITRAFREERGITVRTKWADGGVDFMYAEGQILVRDEYLQRVQRLLGLPDDEQVKRVVDGVVLLCLAPAGDGAQAAESTEGRLTVIEALEIIDARLGVRVASPDHVVTVTQPPPTPGMPCDATEPQEVYYHSEPYPGICTADSGEGVLVYVADTGLLEHASSTHTWLAGVQRAHESNGQLQGWDPPPVQDPTGVYWIPSPYTGHGTFVAGVMRCVAPRADVIVAKVFDVAGSALESDFVPQLTQALGLGVDIFHLSIAAPTRNFLPLLAFEQWLDLLQQYKGVVCVVAAGNCSTQHPYWPAAFPQTVSVGALAADWRSRADFSNYGGWVDVYAPGRDLINAYATGRYKCEDFPYKGQVRVFHGMAKRSGTSFSAPIVTGRIAARMWRTGENGQEAAAALLAEARAHAVPGVGAILLPCRDH